MTVHRYLAAHGLAPLHPEALMRPGMPGSYQTLCIMGMCRGTFSLLRTASLKTFFYHGSSVFRVLLLLLHPLGPPPTLAHPLRKHGD